MSQFSLIEKDREELFKLISALTTDAETKLNFEKLLDKMLVDMINYKKG